MGCANSTPREPDWETVERKGVPVRVEVPVPDTTGASALAFKATHVGKQLEGENRFVLRVDNSTESMAVMLKRPLELNVFSNFNEIDDDEDDDEEGDKMEKFMSRLPNKEGDPIDIVTDGKILKGRVTALRRYEGGEHLLVLHNGQLVDATVDGEPVSVVVSNACAHVHRLVRGAQHCMRARAQRRAWCPRGAQLALRVGSARGLSIRMPSSRAPLTSGACPFACPSSRAPLTPRPLHRLRVAAARAQLNLGGKHRLTLSATGAKAVMDLNEFNHSVQVQEGRGRALGWAPR